MKLDDIKNEFIELSVDIKDKIEQNTSKYVSNMANFESNKRRTLIGIGGIIIGAYIDPALAIIALGYTGIKGYQTYQDSNI